MNSKSLLLHKKALLVAKTIHTGFSDMIDLFEEILVARSYFDFNAKSAFEYATEKLDISRCHAQGCIRLARKSLQVPRLKEEVRAGRIEFWKAVKICSVLNKENQDYWLSVAQKTSKADIEREIAKASPRAAIRDRVTLRMMGDEEWYQVNFGMSAEEMKSFQRVHDLLSQKLGRPARFGEVVSESAEIYLDKMDPLRKKTRPGTTSENSTGSVKVTVKRQVHHESQSQCMHVDEHGNRCQERKFLHIHHKIPRSKGGTNHVDNLIILCAGHHRMHHHKEGQGEEHPS